MRLYEFEGAVYMFRCTLEAGKRDVPAHNCYLTGFFVGLFGAFKCVNPTTLPTMRADVQERFNQWASN